MSPLPFSTTTLIAHGAGRVAAADAAAEGFGFALLRARTTASVAARTSAPTAATAPSRRHRAERLRRRREAGELERVAMVEAEARRIEERSRGARGRESGSGRGALPRATGPPRGRCSRGGRPRQPSAAGAGARGRAATRRPATTGSSVRACSIGPSRFVVWGDCPSLDSSANVDVSWRGQVVARRRAEPRAPRAPSSGTSGQAPRARSTGWRRTPP